MSRLSYLISAEISGIVKSRTLVPNIVLFRTEFLEKYVRAKQLGVPRRAPCDDKPR